MDIENVLLWLECRQGDVCATDQCRRHKRFVPLQITHQSDSASIKSSTSWAFSGRLATPYFEIHVLRSGLFSGQKSGSSYKSLTLLHWEQRMMHRMAGQTQLAERITTSRIY